ADGAPGLGPRARQVEPYETPGGQRVLRIPSYRGIWLDGSPGGYDHAERRLPRLHPSAARMKKAFAYLRMLPAASRKWSRNHACSASVLSRGCQTMKYEKPLISGGSSTTATSAIAAAIFPNLRGTVRTTSLRATVKIVGTKNGIRSTARLLKPRSARGLSTGAC